ncbi:MAG TPA: hypothetical protein ENG03_06910 [Thioploca sp.]|nr:MAG: hypothetical protein DRR19_20550 [Gammaproteobacteria bacterium]HDN26814.1 hypothetical protein [Thioploca sp.]
MHSLHILWLSFFDICRLRLAPQDLPRSNVLLGICLLFYTVLSVGTLSLTRSSISEAILSSIVDTGLLVVLTSSLLYVARCSARIIQTLTALAGANCVLGIFIFPVLSLFEFYESDMSFPLLLLLGLIVWNFVVNAHILRHALTVPFFIGVLLTVLMSSLSFTIQSQLVPFVK